MTTEAARITVLCADDNAEVLAALRQKLAARPEIALVGTRPDATDLLAAIACYHPVVIVLDLDMPGKDPMTVLAEVGSEHPESRVVLFSAHVGPELLERATNAGAWGYVSKGDGEDALVDAIRRVHQGEFVLSPEVQMVRGR